MELLQQYKNGNCSVRIFDDGTKIREFEDVARPVFPESMDLKITDYCNKGCSWCHEKSTVKGIHADSELIINLVDTLPAGVELAIGGGNPLSHPDLEYILDYCKGKGLICNMTVHEDHMAEEIDRLIEYSKNKLIHGIGISYNGNHLNIVRYLHRMTNNVVIHLIIGIQSSLHFENIQKFIPNSKVLLLGYKEYGRGLTFGAANKEIVEGIISGWRRDIKEVTASIQGGTISFDNLAIKQLDMQNILTEDQWKNFYMGDDGQFTMYVDAVKNEFAVSSISPREQLGKLIIAEAFKIVRQDND